MSNGLIFAQFQVMRGWLSHSKINMWRIVRNKNKMHQKENRPLLQIYTPVSTSPYGLWKYVGQLPLSCLSYFLSMSPGTMKISLSLACSKQNEKFKHFFHRSGKWCFIGLKTQKYFFQEFLVFFRGVWANFSFFY